MRPLPRLHAITDSAIVKREDFGIRAAAIASAGPAVALHARDRSASAEELTNLTRRLLAHAGPPESSVFVNGRPDIARGLSAQGVELGSDDLSAADARLVLGQGAPIWVGRSVHSMEEARAAKEEGADFLMLGHVYETPSHAGQAPKGLALLTQVVALGLPVIAIGGITASRVAEVKAAGAWGVAAIRALWDAPDSAVAALALLAPWIAGEPA
ncbi:MAG TPA: thiamine phosphate synthase [Gemmatimonadales bacterium]|nr:thiamine phosphate synthase [Gemmatimonadales bacterium]